MDYTENIGKKVSKAVSKRKFKSGLHINTVKNVINHPILNIPAYTFEEDDSYVECRRCEVIEIKSISNERNNRLTEYQKKILKFIEDNPNTIIITAEQRNVDNDKNILDKIK